MSRSVPAPNSARQAATETPTTSSRFLAASSTPVRVDLVHDPTKLVNRFGGTFSVSASFVTCLGSDEVLPLLYFPLLWRYFGEKRLIYNQFGLSFLIMTTANHSNTPIAHHPPITASDRVAFLFTKSMRFFADTFFRKRYGHRAVVLETVAGVPGMVAGMWTHLTSLRKMQTGYGPKIRTLLAEAENERMHLMTFIEIAKPNAFERILVLVAQAIFWNLFFVIYVFFPRTAHRIVGYFEEEAVYSYTEYLREIDEGRIPNTPAPKIAIDYWKLSPEATLREVVIAVREDEANHRDVNHRFANQYDTQGQR